MQVQVQRITKIGAWAGERPELADHGQHDGEGLRGGVERDVQDRACVDDAVDGFKVVDAVDFVAFDGVGGVFGVLEAVATHGC